MNDKYRQERIERLLTELKHEITVGMLQGEIGEEMQFTFIIPVSKASKNGVVRCVFHTVPMDRGYFSSDDLEPRLKVVK